MKIRRNVVRGDRERDAAAALFKNHRHDWNDFLHVYPVVSRRSRGLSIGINLNPDKKCNFDCVYCQIQRSIPPRVKEVDLSRLELELRFALKTYFSGALFNEDGFKETPPELRRLNDIAFSGEGEPTSSICFLEAVRRVIEIKKELATPFTKLVLITNASGLARVDVRTAVTAMLANQGEIWVKLDAGTEAYYQRVNRTRVPFQRILKNIGQTSLRDWVCISSLFLNLEGEGPSDSEIDAYCGHIIRWLGQGSRIAKIQAYTIARPPAESWAQPLPEAKLREISTYIHARTTIPVECFPG